MKPTNLPAPPASALDRRSFLSLSSLAALAAIAAVAPPTQGVEPPGPGSRRAGGAKPDLYGRWFAV